MCQHVQIIRLCSKCNNLTLTVLHTIITSRIDWTCDDGEPLFCPLCYEYDDDILYQMNMLLDYLQTSNEVQVFSKKTIYLVYMVYISS